MADGFPTFGAIPVCGRRRGADRRRLKGVLLKEWMVVCVALVGFGGGGSGAEEKPGAVYSAYEVKAALLLNFARFVEWPESAFASATAPLRVGTLDRDLDSREVRDLFREVKPIRGRRIEFGVVTTDQEFRECHILFVPRSEKRRSREILQKLRTLPVLTVGESEDFLDQGGVINFVVLNGSMRFEINIDAAKAGSLKLHANLLKVASFVRGQYD